MSCLTNTSYFYFVTLFNAWIVISFSRDNSYICEDSFFYEDFTYINLLSTALKS